MVAIIFHRFIPSDFVVFTPRLAQIGTIKRIYNVKPSIGQAYLFIDVTLLNNLYGADYALSTSDAPLRP